MWNPAISICSFSTGLEQSSTSTSMLLIPLIQNQCGATCQELQANFKAPTYEVMGGTLAPVNKECMGSHTKMFLFTLDELSYMYQCMNNTDT